MHQLINYQYIDIEISKTEVKKISNHLWYLAPETIVIALFYDNISTVVKTNMA